MNSSIEISPQLWNWYVTFFISMGWVLAAAVSFVSAMVFIDGLYLYAKKIETKPTPSSYWGAHFNLSRFQAAVGGVLLAPFLGIALYYFLFFMVWNLAPQQVNAPPLDFEELGFGEQIRGIASLLLYLIALALVLVCTVFFLLYCWTGRIVTEGKAAGWGKKSCEDIFERIC